MTVGRDRRTLGIINGTCGLPSYRALALILVALSGCTATRPPSDVPGTPPQRPDVPRGWVAVRSDDGTVTLTVPPDLVGIPLPADVLVQAPAMGSATPLEVWSVGPMNVLPQPRSGQTLRAWLESGAWLPRAGGEEGIATADVSEAEVQLPSGRAHRVAVTVQPGTPDASRVVAYAIHTPRGFAVLRILGHPDAVRSRSNELELLAQLAEFAAP